MAVPALGNRRLKDWLRRLTAEFVKIQRELSWVSRDRCRVHFVSTTGWRKGRPSPCPLLLRWGEGEDPPAAGSRAASHPSPLSIGWREGEEGSRGGWCY